VKVNISDSIRQNIVVVVVAAAVVVVANSSESFSSSRQNQPTTTIKTERANVEKSRIKITKIRLSVRGVILFLKGRRKSTYLLFTVYKDT